MDCHTHDSKGAIRSKYDKIVACTSDTHMIYGEINTYIQYTIREATESVWCAKSCPFESVIKLCTYTE